MGKNIRLAVALLGTIALQLSSGQTQSINGSIRGRVTDAAGSAIPQAKVEVANTENGYTRSFDTPEDGYFVLPNLPLGTYTVTIQKTGFESRRNTGVVLDAGTEAVINAQLAVGSVSTSIDVSGGAPVVEPSRLNTGRTIDHREVDNLPLTSRNPYNFITFQPGVSGHPNAELGIPRTINTNGLLDRINYQMDGMVNTESDRYGLRLFPISDIYVREIQTVSNSFSPEFGGTSGNIFNVITNSGANQFHSEFYYIGRPVDASARPILLASNKPKPNLTLSDFAVNGSGAFIKDKLFFFVGYEHLNRGLPQPITIDPAAAALIGIPASQLGTAPSVQHAQFLNLRLDWNITAKHQAFLRYNYFRNEYPYNTGVGGLNALSVAADFRDRAHILGAQVLSTLSPTMLNEWRASWPYRNEAHNANPATNGAGPQIVITNVATFGGSSSIGDKFAEKIPSMNDNFTVIKGAHTLKTGFGFQRILDNQVGNVFSRYTFANTAAYLSALSGANLLAYNTFTTILGVPGTHYNSFFWNFFVQDSWQLRPNLLVMYGLRYDKFQSPDGEANAPFAYTQKFRNPSANFAPRVGIAYSITPKTVIRLNGGMFYEAPPTNLWYNAFANDGSARSFSTSFASTATGAPAFPAVFNFIPGASPVTPSITTVTPNFKNAYTTNINFQIQQQLSNNDSLTVGYVHTAARNQDYMRNLNLINPTSFLADGRPVYSSTINANTRLYPQFNNITLVDVGAIANYDALVTHFNHRWSQGFLMSASYTWSHSISDAPDVNSFEQNLAIEDPTSRKRDRGNSVVNRPSAFTLSSVIDPTFKLDNKVLNFLANNNQLTFLATASSGDQVNFTSSRNLNGDTIATSRPLYVGRNTGRGPNIYQFDSRYTRTFFTIRERIKPRFFAEVNNIFNHKNLTSFASALAVDATGAATIPATLTPTSTVLEGRIIQLGIRVDW